MGVITFLIFKLAKTDDISINTSNQFSFKIEKGNIIYTGNSIKNVYLQLGESDELNEENLEDTSSLRSGTFDTKYNFTYTLFVEFKSGEMMHYFAEVTDNPTPIFLTESDGVIYIHQRNNYRINFLYYTYGQTLGDSYAHYISLNSEETKVQAYGNGYHTFRINATGNTGTSTYYVAINVTSCNQPVVIVSDSTVGVYSYGYNMDAALYSVGTYSTRDEVYSSSFVAIPSNIELEKKTFVKGDYTFYFRTKDQKEFFIYKTI